MLQLIALLLCAIIAVLGTIPLQIAWVSTSPSKKAGVISGIFILVGSLAIAGIGVALSFVALPSFSQP